MRTSDLKLCSVVRRSCVVLIALCACRCDVGQTGYVSATTQGADTGSGTGTTGTTSGEGTGTTATTSGVSTGSTSASSGVAADGIAIGLRLEAGGAGALAHPIDDTYWSTTIAGLSQSASGSVPAATLVVGVNQNGNCMITLPKASSTTSRYDHVTTSVDASFDTLLTTLDTLGARVVLEVQPGNATLSDVATAVLNAYGTHASLVGFGVDVQYYGTTGYSASARMTKTEANAVIATIQAINSNLMLYAKAADANNLPDASTQNVVFVNDSSNFGSLAAMSTTQSDWASTFSSASVQFDIGNPQDANWWCGADAASTTTTLMNAALKAGSNVTGLYWQADGIVQLNPNVTCTNANTSGTTTTTTTTGTSTTSGSTTASTSGGSSATSGSTSSGATTASGTTSGTTSSTTATTTTSGTSTSSTTSSGSTAGGSGTTGATTSGSTSSGSATSGTTTSGSTSSGTTSSGTATSGGASAGTSTSGNTSSGSTSGTATSGTATGNAGN